MTAGTRRILIADDDDVIVTLLQVNLELEGYDVVVARDGQEAVEKAAQVHPDLILLDVMMPRLDGWGARKALTEDPDLAGIPVIFLSARAQQADIAKGYELGVAEYITKPFEPAKLLEVVEGILAGTYQRQEDSPGLW